ncbi:MAG: SCO1664 family protein, partial [Nocardioides sp.]
PVGYLHVFDGIGGDDQPVSLIHEDTPELRRMAVFDVLANNADRKGGHVLEMEGGHRYGCDHGLTFHREPKLRTVLWGWTGMPLTDEEIEVVRRVRAALDGPEGEPLSELLAYWDLEALAARCDRLLAAGTMPEPTDDWHVIPWPPF